MKKAQFNTNIFNLKEQKQRWSLNVAFSVVVFVLLLSAIVLAAGMVYVLARFGFIADDRGDIGFVLVIVLMSCISLVIGSVLVFFTSKIPLKPINNLINKMNRLAAGDYKARLYFNSIIGTHPALKEVSISFNKMANELENTELLRGDFINNFSHEFKTPIVSIAGFAKLLRKGNLTEAQTRQYLEAIEEESMRLSYMATNVLNLTKVENQTILSEVNVFNLSEQIRSAVLLFESKWSEKEMELQVDFDEYEIEAGEELLKQVWINLIDNAVKFAPARGVVSIEINEEGKDLDKSILVKVSNTGSEIPNDKIDKIFGKFYQADESHAVQGNGVGLAIVKKIVELHCGEVTVCSGDGTTSFAVRIPKKQMSIYIGKKD